MVDIGGGSTEIVIAAAGQVTFNVSLPLGSVRLTERFVHHNPPRPDEIAAITAAVDAALEGVPFPTSGTPSTLVGVAGTVTSLAAMAEALVSYDPARVQGYRLSQEALAEQIARLSVGTQAARERIIGLDPRRADVILAGALILQRIAAAGGVAEISRSATAGSAGSHARAGPEICGGGRRLIRPGSDGIFWACAAPGFHRSPAWHA